jgi:hypothetical protein
MRLFSNLGRLTDAILEEWWIRLKERRAYVTWIVALLFVVIGLGGVPARCPVFAIIGFLILWFMYVVLGPHAE